MSKKVNVLLSVYKPNVHYLEQQLKSLDAQTWDNMEILIHDDCVDERCDTGIFDRCIQNHPYKVLPYKESNLGYTKAFEYLTENSDGDYIAFCDQDDVWDADKLEVSVSCLEKDGTVLVASDRRLIDENNNVFCDSVRESSNKPWESWSTGDDILNPNFFTTYAIGMCLVAKGDFARSCVPFSENTGHDKWIIACACVSGGVSCIEHPLASYRRHGENVSGVMAGVDTKVDYVNNRVMPHLRLVQEFQKKYPECECILPAYEFATARKNHNVLKLWKYRKLAPDVTKFEIVLAFIPACFVPVMIRQIRKISGK